MTRRPVRLLLSALALCCLAALQALAVCSICGKANCPYDTGSGGAAGIAAPSNMAQLQTEAVKEYIAENPQLVQDVQSGRITQQEAQARIAADPAFQRKVTEKMANDPEVSRYRAEVIQKKAEQMAADHARTFSSVPTPEQSAQDAESAVQGNPSLTGSQREIVAKSATLGQLLVAVAGGDIARASPEQAARFAAGIQFNSGAKSEAVVLRAYADNTVAAAEKQAEAADRLDGIKVATPTAADRASVMKSGGGTPELRSAIAVQAALGGAARVEASERTSIVMGRLPVPPPDQTPKKTASDLEKWGKQAVEKMKIHTDWVINIYPPAHKPDDENK